MSIEAYNHYSDLGLACGFQGRAKSEDEIIEYAVAHAARAHGMKGMLGNAEFIRPNLANTIKTAIKSVMVSI